jgi:hypothetical protein
MPRFTTGSARALTASGSTVPDRDALARELADTLNLLRVDPRDGRTLVASLHAGRPTDRVIDSQDPEVVLAALDATADEHARMLATARAQPQAITAAGGIGAAPDTDYSLVGFETNARPVKAALPTFTTTPGGIRFTRPPKLGDLTGSVGIWTNQNDVDAASNPRSASRPCAFCPGQRSSSTRRPSRRASSSATSCSSRAWRWRTTSSPA